MAENIQGLIEKIQQEGIKAAENKAQEIEAAARAKAGQIIKDAQVQADALRARSEKDCARMKESGETALRQSGRDLMLSLRKEINAVLDRLTRDAVKETLPPEALVKLVQNLIKESAHAKEGIIVSVSEKDAEPVKKHLHALLRGELKKGVTLRSSNDIGAGFIISYDNGNSHYDFTDAALAEYIARFLRPHLAELLKSVAT
ncbi:MAG: hypothetical protein MJA29_06510 [Candidatus Omnitrophica bacterium]|nr:hypothetical protein [Candidatus Omnitrophota bacterium]